MYMYMYTYVYVRLSMPCFVFPFLNTWFRQESLLEVFCRWVVLNSFGFTDPTRAKQHGEN